MPDTARSTSKNESRGGPSVADTVTARVRPRLTERDLEDLAECGITSLEEAESMLEEAASIRRGEVRTYTHEEIVAELGLDH